jgi:hypothetical protein
LESLNIDQLSSTPTMSYATESVALAVYSVSPCQVKSA